MPPPPFTGTERPANRPRKAPSRRGLDGPSTAHGRQQAGESRVESRSAEKRGRQAPGFDGKEIFKDHGSLSRSLVTFCRHRKSLALRRNRGRALRNTPPDAGWKQRGRGKPLPYMVRIRRNALGIGAPHRRAATRGRLYGKTVNVPGMGSHAASPYPREAPHRRGQGGPSTAHGR